MSAFKRSNALIEGYHMNVTNFTAYRNRNKPQAYRVASEAQERRKAHVVTEVASRDLTKWRKRLEASQCQK